LSSGFLWLNTEFCGIDIGSRVSWWLPWSWGRSNIGIRNKI